MSEPVGAGIHLKSTDRVSVLDAIAKATEATGLQAIEDDDDQPGPDTQLRLLVLKARGGWTSVYVEQTWRAPPLASALARSTGAPALLARKSGDWACAYQAFDAQGLLVDAYHSCPDADKGVGEDDASSAELERTRGDGAKLGAVLGGGDTTELVELLRANRVERLRDHDPDVLPDPDAVLAALAQAFGLPDLSPDFDEVRHFLAEEEDLDLVLRSFAAAPPVKEPRQGLLARMRKKKGQEGPEGEDQDSESDASASSGSDASA